MPSALAVNARATLETWAPPSVSQAALREAYLATLLTDEGSLWRAHEPGHFTVGALILDASAAHTLLVLHPKAGMWLPPGGHIEPEDTSLAETALREAREETGLSDITVSASPLLLDAHPFRCSLGVPTRHLNVGFVVRAGATPDGALPATTISDESLDLRWWPIDALPTTAPERLAMEVAAAVAS